jgi:hypothetical protein
MKLAKSNNRFTNCIKNRPATSRGAMKRQKTNIEKFQKFRGWTQIPTTSRTDTQNSVLLQILLNKAYRKHQLLCNM